MPDTTKLPLNAEAQELIEEARLAFSPPEDETGAPIRLKIDRTDAAILIARMRDYIMGDPYGNESICFHGLVCGNDGPEPCPTCVEKASLQSQDEDEAEDRAVIAKSLTDMADVEGDVSKKMTLLHAAQFVESPVQAQPQGHVHSEDCCEGAGSGAHLTCGKRNGDLDRLGKNDVLWLRDVARCSENADTVDDRYLWVEDVANLRRIADLVDATLQAKDRGDCLDCGYPLSEDRGIPGICDEAHKPSPRVTRQQLLKFTREFYFANGASGPGSKVVDEDLAEVARCLKLAGIKVDAE